MSPQAIPAQAGPSQARSIAAFVLVALVWGSTWLVIKDQLGTVPPGWSVTWRFALAAAGMFALAALRREPLVLPREGMLLAPVLGLFQFFANFQLVYRAEHYVTSGLVAVLFALLLVPNALLARLFLGTRVGGRFIAGSAVALGGIALLVAHEYRAAPASESVLIGIALVGCALLCASSANVLQASRRARAQPMVPLLAWAMLWGTLADAAFAWATSGPPVIEWRAGYLAGVAYLGIVGSVLTFPLYFALIRDWGPGRRPTTGWRCR